MIFFFCQIRFHTSCNLVPKIRVTQQQHLQKPVKHHFPPEWIRCNHLCLCQGVGGTRHLPSSGQAFPWAGDGKDRKCLYYSSFQGKNQNLWISTGWRSQRLPGVRRSWVGGVRPLDLLPRPHLLVDSRACHVASPGGVARPLFEVGMRSSNCTIIANMSTTINL